jgi:hypothetical protein
MKKHTNTERYVRLTHRIMKTEAWRSLDGNARAIYIEITARYHGNNNGRIGFSARQAGEAIQVSKATAARAMIVLQERGFIVAVTKGRFNRLRHSSEWRLTEFRCDVTGQPASRDFDLWHCADIIPLVPRKGGIDG